MIQQQELWFESRGVRLSALAQWPNGDGPFTTVVLCHGLTNSKFTCPMINEAAEELLKAGYAIFRFDFYGSGDSAGLFQDKTIVALVDNLRACFNFIPQVRVLDVGRICIWGRSVGATVAVLGSWDKRLLATVLISPPFYLYQTFYGLYEAQGKADYTSLRAGGPATGHVKGDMQLPRAFFEELAALDKQIEEAAQHLHTVRIIQGGADQKVGVSGAQALHQLANEPKDLVIVPGASHAFSGQEDLVIELAVEWLIDHVPPH